MKRRTGPNTYEPSGPSDPIEEFADARRAFDDGEPRAMPEASAPEPAPALPPPPVVLADPNAPLRAAVAALEELLYWRGQGLVDDSIWAKATAAAAAARVPPLETT